MSKWISRHRNLATVFTWALSLALGFALLYLTDSAFLSVFIFAVVEFVLFIFVNSAPQQMLVAPQAKAYNECDPFPFYDAVEELLTYNLQPATRQAMLINKAAALSWIGKKNEYHELIRSINIDSTPAALPANKYIYYHNLTDAYAELGNYDVADAFYEKGVQIYTGLKPKEKDALFYSYRMSECEHLFRKGDMNGARCIADQLIISSSTMLNRVYSNLLCARICLKMGDTAAAREKLEFVVANGNKLYAVNEARELLDTLEG